jgi:hypothetical protein
MKHLRGALHFALIVPVLAAFVVPATLAFESMAHAGTPSTYSIDFHVISAGGNSLKSSCFRLKGTVGQPAPGYSSGAIYSLIAGYWQPASSTASDEIFYNGFEGCSI